MTNFLDTQGNDYISRLKKYLWKIGKSHLIS